MMRKSKTTKIIFISIIACLIIFLGVVTGLTWKYFVGMFKGEKYYTQEQYVEYGQEKENEAFKDREELQAQLDEARSKVLEQKTQIFTLEVRIGELEKEALDLKNQREQAVKEKELAENKVAGLEQTISENEAKISENSAEIVRLKSELETIKGQESVNQATIESLASRIQGLEAINAQLIATNNSHTDTIVELNKSISALNSKIIELNEQITANTNSVSVFKARIAQLEKSVQTYEAFIAQVAVENKVVATFEFDGGVYNIQLVNKGSAAVVSDPESTDFVIFNYWQVKDQKVENLATYYLVENTKFVANVTYKYSVKFMNGDQQIEEQIVEKNGYATAPSQQPAKDGFIFEGWTINGSDIVDVSSYSITKNTVFIAKFSKLATVTFMYEQDTKSTQQVKVGEHPQNVEVESTTYKKFNGWKVNGVLVENVEEYVVNGDTVFVADITYYFDVKFKVDESDYNSQVIVENGFAVKPADPTKQGYVFDYWTVDGSNQVDPTTYKITQTTNFIAKFTKTYEVTFDIQGQQQKKTVRIDEELTAPELHIDGQLIGWTDEVGTFISNLSEYELSADVKFTAVVYDKAVGVYKYSSGGQSTPAITITSNWVILFDVRVEELNMGNGGAFVSQSFKYHFDKQKNAYLKEDGSVAFTLDGSGNLVITVGSYGAGTYTKDSSYIPQYEGQKFEGKYVHSDGEHYITLKSDGTFDYHLGQAPIAFDGTGDYFFIYGRLFLVDVDADTTFGTMMYFNACSFEDKGTIGDITGAPYTYQA